MKKLATERTLEVIPELISNLKDWLKTGFEEHAQDILDGSSGTIGLVIKVLGKKVIENYFDKISVKKLQDFGSITYLKAAYKQACQSIVQLEKKLDNKVSVNEIILSLEEVLNYELSNFNRKHLVLAFQVNYHPAVVAVKNAFVNLLKQYNVAKELEEAFLKSFNDSIKEQIENEFGEDYSKHLSDIKKFIFQEREIKLLMDMVKLNKIGFSDEENLSYEVTYAEWKPVFDLNSYVTHSGERYTHNPYSKVEDSANFIKHENSLKKANDLIDGYFKYDSDVNIEKILFMIADFGKGKSVFLKHYASVLATNYIATGNGYIPVYFNLRNYSNYSSESSLGVIHDFLQTVYGINITSDYYKIKKYLFLVDSLDESGELSKRSIEKVIDSVKRIQNIDKSLYRDNRIIITSRPFDGGLQNFLEQHKPFIINDKKKEISQYISVYGFKSNQFNSWLNNAIKNAKIELNDNSPEFVRRVIANVNKEVYNDIYNELLESNTLSRSELQRPIFAYMIYQLIINNVDFLRIGKIGVYLSFLNLLSKEAKHINDPSYKVNLKEEFEFRNILHAIASLWMFERHQGKQGALNKADICRVLEGQNSGESDSAILARFKDKKVLEIEFLSHSYFGENNNTLHFQHQSFAEILLAEYYLKVFIKYALDEDGNPDDARAKLMLGQPTDQTVSFFIELLQLLKETSVEECTQEVIQKRKLLFPLLASLSIRKNNLLMCNELAYNWYRKCDLEESSSDYPEASIMNWCINQAHIRKICLLASEILNSSNSYYLTNSERKSALFDNELTIIKNSKINKVSIAMDRWLALIVGNTLYNVIDINAEYPLLFNNDFKISYINLFDMLIGISDISVASNSMPSWGGGLFMGIDMKDNKHNVFINKFISDINFSFSYLKNIDFVGSLFVDSYFENCFFDEVSFSHTTLYRVSFDNIKEVADVHGSGYSVNINGKIIPFDLFNAENTRFLSPRLNDRMVIPNLDKLKGEEPNVYMPEREVANIYRNVLDVMKPFLIFQIRKKTLDSKKIESLLMFENVSNKNEYFVSLGL